MLDAAPRASFPSLHPSSAGCPPALTTPSNPLHRRGGSLKAGLLCLQTDDAWPDGEIDSEKGKPYKYLTRK